MDVFYDDHSGFPFSYLTPTDFEWSLQNYPLFVPRLTSIALQQLLKSFTAGLLSFPEFHESENEEVEAESNESEEFLQFASSVMESVPGHVGEIIRAKMLAALQKNLVVGIRTMRIKPSVLVTMFGHRDLATLSIKFGMRPSQREDTIFNTIAFRCNTLKELTIDFRTSLGFSYWNPLKNLVHLDSLTLIGDDVPLNLDIELRLKTLSFQSFESAAYPVFLLPFFLKPFLKYCILTSGLFPDNSPNKTLCDEFIACAQNQNCLQPFCQTLTTLSVNFGSSSKFYPWCPINVAFLLLACPKLETLHTMNEFPYGQALSLLKEQCLESSCLSFGLRQTYVILDFGEDFEAIIQSTPSGKSLIVQGARNVRGVEEAVDVTLSGQLLRRLMDAVGDKVSSLAITLRGFTIIFIEDLAALTEVRNLRLQEYSMLVKYAERNSSENKPVFEKLVVLAIEGCLVLSPSKERDLLSQCPNIEELYLQCLHFCSSGKQLVRFATHYWKQLKIIFIKTSCDCTWGFEDVSLLLHSCPKLKFLVLPHNFVYLYSEAGSFERLNEVARHRNVKLRFASADEGKLYCQEDL